MIMMIDSDDEIVFEDVLIEAESDIIIDDEEDVILPGY